MSTYVEQTIADYLSGTVAVDVPEKVISTILTRMNIQGDTNAVDVDEKDRDLAEAELL